MPDADIVLDVSSIELNDGDVTIAENLTVEKIISAEDEIQIVRSSPADTALEVRDDATKRVEITAGGVIIIYHANGSTPAVRIDSNYVRLYSSSGGMKIAMHSATGDITCYGDITMVNGDIKLDGTWLSTLLP